MDEQVIRAMARWPDVPEVHGWLRLDRRGDWRIRDEPIRHAGMRSFIGRNYQASGDGQWYFQNGPQRVYVELDAAPYVVRLHQGELIDQCDDTWPATDVVCWVDEAGDAWISTARGLAILDDRDLDALLSRLQGDNVLDEQALADPPPEEGFAATEWRLELGETCVPVRRSRREWLLQRFMVDTRHETD